MLILFNQDTVQLTLKMQTNLQETLLFVYKTRIYRAFYNRIEMKLHLRIENKIFKIMKMHENLCICLKTQH